MHQLRQGLIQIQVWLESLSDMGEGSVHKYDTSMHSRTTASVLAYHTVTPVVEQALAAAPAVLGWRVQPPLAAG